MKRTSSPEALPSNQRFFPTVGHIILAGCNYRVIVLSASRDDAERIAEICERQGLSVVRSFKLGDTTCGLVREEDCRAAGETDPVDILTPREVQIATLVAKGRLNKQIADHLHISEWTVATHLRRMFAKLGVDTRAAMVYRCNSLLSIQDSKRGASVSPLTE